MKENYGRKIFGIKANNWLQSLIYYCLFSFIGAIPLTCIFIQLHFKYGLITYLELIRQKLYLYFRVEYLPNAIHHSKMKPTNEDIIFYDKINQYWEILQETTKMYQAIFVVSFLVCMFICYKFFKSYGEKEQEIKYERADELRLVSNKELIKEIKNEVNEKNNNTHFTPYDLYFGINKIRVPYNLLSTHVGLGGASQSGKTNVMHEMLIQDRELKSKCLIVDPRGQFYKKHGRKGDTILSLFDIRQAKWDFWSENIAFKFLADALVEVKDSSNNKNFFDKSGREVLAAALRHTKSLDELWEVVNYNMKSLHDFLVDKNELSKQLLGEGAGPQSAGIIATSILNMSFIKSMNHHAYEREKSVNVLEKSFSLTEWVNNDEDESWVFIVDDIRNLPEAQPLHRLWFDIVTSSGFDRKMSKPNLKQINLYCDEITTVGNLPSLPSVLDKGRNFKLRLIIGFQAYSQLELIYGKDAAVNIFQGLQNVFCFTSNNETEASLFAARMGKSIIVEADQSLGLGDKNGNASISYRTREIQNVTASQIQALKDNNCFAKISRVNPTKIEFKFHDLPDLNPDSISIVPKTTRFDGVKTKQYESDEMKKEREQSIQSEMPNTKITEMNQYVKSLVEEAVLLLSENADSNKIEELGKKILDKFGASQGIKAKIGQNIYSISVHKQSKTIYINTSELEYSIPFPKVKISAVETGDEANTNAPKNQDTSESTGQKGNFENDDAKEIEKPKGQFKSIPINLKKSLIEKETAPKNEMGL